MVEALGRMKDPRAFDVAVEMLDDEEVDGMAVRALGNLKDARARLFIEPFPEHSDRDLRKLAEKAIRKLDGADK